MVFEHSVVNMFLFPVGPAAGRALHGHGLPALERDPDGAGQPGRRPAFTGLTLYATHVQDRARSACSSCRADAAYASPGRPSSADMPRAEVSLGQHSDKGRKEVNQDFHGAVHPAEPLLSVEGHRDRAGRRHRQQRREPGRQRVRRHGLPRRLLLHVGGLVGEEVGASACWRRPTPGCTAQTRQQPVPLRQGPRLRLHAERAGDQVAPPRTCSTSATRASTALHGGALEQLTQDHRVVRVAGARAT